MTIKTISTENWEHIRKIVAQAQNSSMHCAIATVDQKGMPSITPIGTLFLKEQLGQAFFFNTYSQQIEKNSLNNPKICIQAVNSSRLYWIKSMLQGHFKHIPGVRMYAEISTLRKATQEELDLVEHRIRSLKWTKGGQMIWSNFQYVHDINIQQFRWIEYPHMM